MSHYVVTISRQFAAMGRTIGLKMASNLGIELLDRDIVKEAAKRLGLQKGEISHYDENPGRQSFFLRRLTFLISLFIVSTIMFLKFKRTLFRIMQTKSLASS